MNSGQPSELEAIIQDQTAQSIDFNKLRVVAKNGILWLLGILLFCFSAAYLIVRYTKPVYESSSEIKLDHEDQSNFLGLPAINNTNSFGLLSSEMELIKSRLFFSKIIESVRLNPQYFTYGSFLVDEKYRSPPFLAKYQLKILDLYDKHIDVTILSEQSYRLSYTINDELFKYSCAFGEKTETPHISLTISLSDSWANDAGGGREFYFIVNSHATLVNFIDNNLMVEPLNLEANTFKISFRDNNIYKAHDLVSAIDTLYYQYSLEEKNQANQNKIDYLNTQLKETETKLDDFENYFEQFTINNRTVNLDEDVKHTIELINGLDSQRINLKERIADLELVHQRIIQENISNISINRSYYPKYLVEAIDELNLQINEKEKLGISYKENTYTYQSRQKDVDLLKSDVIVEVSSLKTRLYVQLNELSKQKATLGDKLMKLPSKSTEYNKAKRFYSLYEEIYLSLVQSKNEFEIAVAGSTTKIKILSPASLPVDPIAPNKMIIYGAASALSILLVFVFLVIGYLLHDKLNSVSEIENLTSIPILGSVPEFQRSNQNGSLFVQNKPRSAVSESLRTIRTNLEFMSEVQGPKIYSITSTIGAEGKTFFSTNLGALIAMTGKKVIILDLDLRKPKVHLTFDDAASNCGVSTLLIEKHKLEECILSTDIENLDYIAAGPIPPNPSELLLRNSFDNLLSRLQKKYDVILLDTPPVGLVTDGLLAMQKSDLPIYLLRANYSKRAFVDNINRIAKSGKFNNLSIVFNASTSLRSNYGYQYGYGNKNNTYYDI